MGDPITKIIRTFSSSVILFLIPHPPTPYSCFGSLMLLLRTAPPHPAKLKYRQGHRKYDLDTQKVKMNKHLFYSDNATQCANFQRITFVK